MARLAKGVGVASIQREQTVCFLYLFLPTRQNFGHQKQNWLTKNCTPMVKSLFDKKEVCEARKNFLAAGSNKIIAAIILLLY